MPFGQHVRPMAAHGIDGHDSGNCAHGEGSVWIHGVSCMRLTEGSIMSCTFKAWSARLIRDGACRPKVSCAKRCNGNTFGPRARKDGLS